MIKKIAKWGIKHENFIVHFRKDTEILSNRAENISESLTKKAKLPLDAFCIRPFNQMYILFNGDAVICCQDWKAEDIMGNVDTNSIQGVWSNNKYDVLRRKLMMADRKIGICEKCDFKGF